MAQTKKIPLRMCISCREMKPKQELIRIVALTEKDGGGIAIDLKGKRNGRGAYICRSLSCLEKAKKSNAIKHSLEIEVPQEFFNDLENEIKLGGSSL